MKKFILVMVMLILSISMYAQPQHISPRPLQIEFFDRLELGRRLTKCKVKKITHRYLNPRYEEGNTVYYTASNKNFGGYYWELVQMYSVKGKLYRMQFTKNTVEDDRYVFDSLVKSLTRKYGVANPIDNGFMWVDAFGYALTCTYQYSQALNGEWKYFTVLTYTDLLLWKKTKTGIDEL